MNNKSLLLNTPDGFVLSATVYAPEQSKGPVILLNPANAVKENYYADFANYLAKLGYWVYTYAYRGFGKGKPAKMRGFQASMRDWIFQDYATVLGYIAKNHPESRKIVVGHSFGGQIIPLLPESETIDLGIMVAAQTGAWRAWEGKGRRMMWTLAHVLLPTTTAVWGYVPARWGLGEDLPKGVAQEWAQWIKSPNYYFDFLPEARTRCENFRMPVLAWSFADDDYAPLAPVKAYLNHFRQAPIEHRHLHPADIAEKKIGHFGFFRKNHQDKLWKESVEWISKQLAQTNPPSAYSSLI
ncbi:MAG: alpha/beta fold hydrolase [Microscillaceae bacterium]